MKYLFILLEVFLLAMFAGGCAVLPEPEYAEDGIFYCDGIPFTGSIAPQYDSGQKWTELEYISGVPGEYLMEWDKNGNFIGKRKIDPKDVEYQWKHHRRHLPIKLYDNNQ